MFSVLPPLLKLFNHLPPSAPAPLLPPIPHVIHCLIAVPVTPALRPIWFSNQTKSEASSRSSKNSSPSGTPGPSGTQSNGSSPTHSKHGAFDRALSRLSASRKSFSRSSSPQPPPIYDNLQHAYDLLDTVLSHYLPGSIDPDDPSVRERCTKEADSKLEDIVSPLVLLITRLCTADEISRKRLRGWILPDDLDRTSPLESRSDLLGRCLRLLSCVHHPRLKDAAGEMLYAACNSDGMSPCALFLSIHPHTHPSPAHIFNILNYNTTKMILFFSPSINTLFLCWVRQRCRFLVQQGRYECSTSICPLGPCTYYYRVGCIYRPDYWYRTTRKAAA